MQARLGRSWQAPGGPESWVGDGRTREDEPGDFSAGPQEREQGALHPPRETAETPAAAATPSPLLLLISRGYRGTGLMFSSS